MITLDAAIKLIQAEYEKAEKAKHIYNPLAFAIYKVWKMVDKDKQNIRKLPPIYEDDSPKVYLDITPVLMPTNGYIHCKTVDGAKELIEQHEQEGQERITLIDMSYRAGPYKKFGGDYIELLHWLNESGRDYPVKLHGDTPYYRSKLRKFLQEYGFQEVK